MDIPGPNSTFPQGPSTTSGQNAGQKRPAFEHNKEQPSKRRAARACLSCRNRKVRCDVVNGGRPCTNCRLDNQSCVVKESNRGRKPGVLPTVSNQAPPESPPHYVSHNRPFSPVRSSRSQRTPSPGQQQHSRPSEDLDALAYDGKSIVLTNSPEKAVAAFVFKYEPNFSVDQPSLSPSEQAGDEVPVVIVPQSNLGHVNNSSSKEDNPPLTQSPTSVHCQVLPKVNASGIYLPPYIKPMPRHITDRDISYLADKDALTIPDNALRDEILRAYVTIVYPFMPTVDLEDFLLSIIQGSERGSVSLILFQAIMFASVGFVDAKLLQSRGYSSRKAARKVFFSRVRLLYALDFEQEHLPLLQAVLLMTYWYDCPSDGKDSWYWTGIAFSLAQVVGIHRETELCRTTIKKKRLRRRIWWSCIIQDRLLAMGIRRPSRIRDKGYNVPQLTLNDFDLNEPSHTVIKFLGKSGMLLSDPSARSTMAVMCIELSKLAVCLGHILHSQYSVVSDQPMIAEYMLRIIVVPTRSKSSADDVTKCDLELKEFVNNQDARSKYTTGTRQTGDKNETDRIIRLHQAILRMNYLAAVNILHKPQVFYAESETTDSNAQKKSSREKVTNAAIALTKLAFDMQMDSQLQYLSTSSVPAFLSAALSHLGDMRSHEEEIRNISVGRFYQCIHVLHQLKSVYSSADFAIHFLEAVLRKSDIAVPSLVPELPSTKPNWNKPQLLGCRSSTPESEAVSQVATAYPSPSSHPNITEPPAGIWNGTNNHNCETGNDDLRCHQYSSEAWSDGDSQLDAPNIVAIDFLPDSSYMGNWFNVGSPVPAFMNFDSSNTWAVPNNVTSGEELGLL
ncbi:fungal-specific transcription factor domain-containing protein [Penicillium pulvis]|uniref:fungal-specific transcription factor domain-containing protein n=1 Tax=Penicillium pulvis TaxID=1562058 RepID=UPI00254983F9|nr:fungal-specific transcription factor domain-containing protein [Penicillium pulvis]KAJ5814265.1 fungal-specific transcription factor domain-containing protein [Penicillium pulvis]